MSKYNLYYRKKGTKRWKKLTKCAGEAEGICILLTAHQKESKWKGYEFDIRIKG